MRTLLLPFLTALACAQTTVTSTRDNTLYAITNGSLSNGLGTGMFSGVTLGGEVRRAVVAFDLTPVVPTGAVVTAVSVQMFVTMSASAAGNMSLHRLVADWGEGSSLATMGGGGSGAPSATGDATWLHRFFPSVTWTNQGGDFAPAPSATVVVGSLGFQTWISTTSLIADVQAWVDRPAVNFGWIVITPELLADRTRRFATREHTVPAERPQLTVTFLPPPAAAFTTFGSGCAGSAGTPSLAALASSRPVLGTPFAMAIANLPAGTGACIGVLGFSARGSAPTRCRRASPSSACPAARSWSRSTRSTRCPLPQDRRRGRWPSHGSEALPGSASTCRPCYPTPA